MKNRLKTYWNLLNNYQNLLNANEEPTTTYQNRVKNLTKNLYKKTHALLVYEKGGSVAEISRALSRSSRFDWKALAPLHMH